MAPETTDESVLARPSPAAIFFSFARIGAFLLGGGYAMLPLLEDEIVRRRKWATRTEMADFFALAQILPGVIAVNAAMLTGNRLRGLAGNVAAALGVTAVPFFLIVAYAMAYAQAREWPTVLRMLEGARPAVAGMMLGMGIRMTRKTARNGWGLGVAVAACAGVVLWNLPMAGLIAGAIAAALLLHACRIWRAARARRGGC